jgi:hypothetical protein
MNTSSTELNTLDAVIAVLVNSYSQASPETAQSPRMVQVKRTRTDCPAAKKALVSKQNSPTVREMSAVSNTPAPTVLPLPTKGSIDAATYFRMMRNAKQLNDRIQAIAAFIGYDPTLSYSCQEVAANLKARQTSHPVKPFAVPVHSVQATVKGYVAGANDATEKHLRNLQAREVMAGNAKADHIKSYHSAYNRADYTSAATFLALVKVEEERLDNIRAEIAAL